MNRNNLFVLFLTFIIVLQMSIIFTINARLEKIELKLFWKEISGIIQKNLNKFIKEKL